MCWLFIAFAVGRVHEFVPGLGNVPLVRGIAGLWLLACIIEARKIRGPGLLATPLMRTTFWLFALAAVSLGFSIWRGGTWEFLTGSGLVTIVAIVLVYRTMASWEDIKLTLRFFVLVGLVLAAVGFLRYAGGRLEVESMYDTNDLAYLLVTVIPICVGFFQISKGSLRIAYAGVAVFLVLGCLLTQSRGALLAIVAIGATYFLFPPVSAAGANAPRDGSRPARARTGARFAIVVTFVVAFALVWSVLPDDARSRLGLVTDLSSDYNLDTDNRGGRINIWTRLANHGLERPIGAGAGTAPMVDLRTGGQFRAPHNSVLQVFVELGFLGLLLYLRVHWLAWSGLSRLVKGTDNINPDASVMARCLQVSLVANFVAAFFLSMAYSNVLWVLMAVLAALSARTLPVPSARPRPV